MTDIKTAFTPDKHGFHFSNGFVNQVADLPIVGKITTKGRCGGMAFCALDYFYSGLPIPTHRGTDFPGGSVPPDGSRLADMIYSRLMDSFWDNGARFFEWTLKRDHSTWVWGDGVCKLTKEEEFPKLLQRLAKGPVVLGLVKATSIDGIGDNHQVVAYGAKYDESTGEMTVYVYDNNHPDSEIALTSDPSDPYFTSSSSNHTRYRGWFIEDYSPRKPDYVDLALVRGLVVNQPWIHLGGPLDCGYTVRNFGQFPANISSLGVQVACPTVDPVKQKFAPETGANSLAAGQEFRFTRHSDCFAEALGTYVLLPTYAKPSGESIVPPMAFDAAGMVQFLPSIPLSFEVKDLSASVTLDPPYVHSVEVVQALDGNAVPTATCETPRTKYKGAWSQVNDTSPRRLDVFSETIIPVPNKTLFFTIRFSTPGPMKKETVKLTLVGTMSNGAAISVPVPLQGSGTVFVGKWKPQSNLQFGCQLTLRIEGEDEVFRYPRRTPRGNVLDGTPASIASVQTQVAGYPFKNYEPGADLTHKISLVPLPSILAADRLEANDTFASATSVQLVGTSAGSQSNGAWNSFDALALQSATDQDVFQLQYVSAPGDDTCAIDVPSKVCLSEFLGLYVTYYPPCLTCTVQGNGNCVDLDLLDGDTNPPQLVQAGRKRDSFLLYNPTRTFSRKKAYVVVKNADFKFQGAFGYSIGFGYFPMRSTMQVDTNAPGYAARPDVRRIILKRLFAKIDLPRPGDDLLGRVIDRTYPIHEIERAITDWQSFAVGMHGFLAQTETLADLRGASSLKDAHSTIAASLAQLSAMAASAKVDAKTIDAIKGSSAKSYAAAKEAGGQGTIITPIDPGKVIGKGTGKITTPIKGKIDRHRLDR